MNTTIINPSKPTTRLSNGVAFIKFLWSHHKNELVHLTSEDVKEIWSIVDKYERKKLVEQRNKANELKKQKEEQKIKEKHNS